MEEIIQEKYLNRVLRPGLTKAEIEKIVLDFLPVGRIVGKLGDWYVRWYKGKPIIYKLPKFYKISQSEASVSNRSSLAAATKIAVTLNNIDVLKQVWNKSRINGNCAYRKILRHNKERLKNNCPSEKISLTPEKCHFQSNITMVLNNNETSEVLLNFEGFSGIHDKLVVVLFAYDPIEKSSGPFEIIKLWDSSPVTKINLTDEQQEICSRYQKYYLCSAVIRSNVNEITWSDTVIIKGIFKHYIETLSSELLSFVLIYASFCRSGYINIRFRSSLSIHSPPG